MSSETTAARGVRLDKWLWAARFYKTRALATTAVGAGHVHVNGVRPKPSRLVQIGDVIELRKGAYRFTLTVRSLAQRRGPAPEARALYTEHEESIRAREALAAERRLHADAGPAPERRPDKRSRRHIIRFRRRNES